SALTPGLFRKARETVDCETPARSATSNDVGRSICVPLDGEAGRLLSPCGAALSIRGGGPADGDRQAVVAGTAVPAAPELALDQRADEAGAEAFAVELRRFGKAAFGPVERDLAPVAAPADRELALAGERAIFDAVGDEFVDRERDRLRAFVFEA